MHGESARNKDINEFEVYNMGHLFTSACLYKRMTERILLDIARKAAGYLANLYDQAEKTGNVQTAVCPSHYMGLIEVYRTTGDESYLELAESRSGCGTVSSMGWMITRTAFLLKEHKENYRPCGPGNLFVCGGCRSVCRKGRPGLSAGAA